jgi:TctA family transporter
MRDMHDDAFPTLISVFGRGKSILLSGVLLVCSYFFGLMHSDVLYNHMSWIFYVLLVFLLLLWLRKKRNRDLASFLIDGVIVAKGATQILIVTL